MDAPTGGTPGGTGGRGARVIVVDDPDDPRLDDYRRLDEPRYRRTVETASMPGFLIAEGVGVVRRLLASALTVRSVLLTPPRLVDLAPVLDRVTAPVYTVERDVLQGVVGFDLHRGVVAAADRPVAMSLSELTSSASTLAVLEGINDHENLGAILRSGSALGVDGVLLDPTCCDPYYRRSVRVSMGAAFLVPQVRSVRWPGDLDLLREAGFTLAALTPAAGAVAVDEVALTDRVAVLLGAEGPGLSDAARSYADVAVRIPMAGPIDSLNVGHAAAIAFQRFARP